MFRILAMMGLACLCVASCSLSGIAVPSGFASAIPAQSEEADKATAAEYHMQEVAASRIEFAARELQDDLKGLLRLKKSYPDDKELDLAIAQLRRLLAPLYESGAAASAKRQRETDLPKVVAETQTLNAAAEQAVKGASEGHEIVNRIVLRLAPLADTASSQKNDSQVAPPASMPTTKNSQPPPGGGARSPASVPESSPPRLEPAPAPPSPSASQAEDPEAAWYAKLANGLMQYSVPTLMLWKVPATVTVRIAGEKTESTQAIEGETGKAPIKVARHMKVLVTAPDNPDEFVIAPEPDTTLEEYVPADGPTTWHFSVTPRYTAKEQKLVVQAWVIYDANTQRELPVYSAVVNVHVPGLGESLKRLFQGDPDYWLKYGLPGGAGFIFLSGIVTGVWKWVRNRKKKAGAPAAAG